MNIVKKVREDEAKMKAKLDSVGESIKNSEFDILETLNWDLEGNYAHNRI